MTDLLDPKNRAFVFSSVMKLEIHTLVFAELSFPFLYSSIALGDDPQTGF